jgi:hypothetical protein
MMKNGDLHCNLLAPGAPQRLLPEMDMGAQQQQAARHVPISPEFLWFNPGCWIGS